VLEVTDNGCGMSSETQRQIFEPFFTTKLNGHGLGMSAVLGIVRGHDGFIIIHSETGKGTTFQVCFPVSNPDTADVPAQTGAMQQMKGRVLLVDDEADILEAATAMLEEHGMEVITAIDGVDALEKFQHQHALIDLTIMDLSMPRMGGIDCMQQMRNIDAGCKIILTSGYHESEIREQYSDLNHTQFLQNPYHLDKLINSIQLQ